MPKAVFFDIDGTLWDRHNNIPESAKESIRTIRRNGHLAFIDSGRTRGYITDPGLLSIGFDGIVSGCGTMLEYRGETIFRHLIDRDLAARTIKLVRGYGMRPILEGPEYLYMEEREFGNDPYGRKLFKELGDRRVSIDDNEGKWDICKLSCATEGCDIEACYGELKEEFDFIIHSRSVVEMVPRGFGKGKGLIRMAEAAGISVSDTIAIGDSVNDIDMFQTAGLSIAMGNGSDTAKDIADKVTTPMTEDGIRNALMDCGLM